MPPGWKGVHRLATLPLFTTNKKMVQIAKQLKKKKSSDQVTFLQKVRSLSPCAVANRSLAFLLRFWSSGLFLAEQPFRLCRCRTCFIVDIDTFVPVSSSSFTTSFAVVLGLNCTFRTFNSRRQCISFLSGMTAACAHGFYTCVLLFVQMNVVHSGIWKWMTESTPFICTNNSTQVLTPWDHAAIIPLRKETRSVS